MNKKKSILDGNVLYTIIAIIVGFLIGAVFLLIAGISPAAAYGKLINSIFSKPKYLVWTLTYASPLIFTGLSVAFSFRTGVFNIGAEGQFVVGSLAACVIGILVDVPAVIHIPLCILAAAAAGAIWSLMVGLLKVKRGIHEVLSFIMFNWIAFYLSNYVVNLSAVHKSGSEATKDILDSARILYPKQLIDILGCSAANWGFVIAVVAAVIIWVIIEKTTLGYKLRAVGFNGRYQLRPFRADCTGYFRRTGRSWRRCSASGYVRTSEPVCRPGRIWIRGNHGCTDWCVQPHRLHLCRYFLRSYEIRRIKAEYGKSACRGCRYHYGMCHFIHCHFPYFQSTSPETVPQEGG